MPACSQVLVPSMPKAIDVPSKPHPRSRTLMLSARRTDPVNRRGLPVGRHRASRRRRQEGKAWGLFKLAPCDMKSSNTAAASLIVSHRELSTDVSVTWSNNSSQNSGMPSKSASRPRNMRISQFPMEASDTDGFEYPAEWTRVWLSQLAVR